MLYKEVAVVLCQSTTAAAATMNFLLGRYFLFAGLLVLSTWAQEVPENECQGLLNTHSMDDRSVMLGKWYMAAGYTNSSAFDAILNITDSSWIKIVESHDGSLVMLEGNNFNGTCVRANISMTVESDRSTAKMGNITSVFRLLPSCDKCLTIMGISTVGDLSMFSKFLNMDFSSPSADEEHVVSSIYLMVAEPNMEPDLKQFKEQARCMGFTEEPDYQRDSTKVFCGDHEGIFMKT